MQILHCKNTESYKVFLILVQMSRSTGNKTKLTFQQDLGVYVCYTGETVLVLGQFHQDYLLML